jgi:hypothetical protein
MVTKSFPRTECRGTAMLSCPPAQRGVGHDLLAGGWDSIDDWLSDKSDHKSSRFGWFHSAKVIGK